MFGSRLGGYFLWIILWFRGVDGWYFDGRKSVSTGWNAYLALHVDAACRQKNASLWHLARWSSRSSLLLRVDSIGGTVVSQGPFSRPRNRETLLFYSSEGLNTCFLIVYLLPWPTYCFQVCPAGCIDGAKEVSALSIHTDASHDGT